MIREKLVWKIRSAKWRRINRQFNKSFTKKLRVIGLWLETVFTPFLCFWCSLTKKIFISFKFRKLIWPCHSINETFIPHVVHEAEICNSNYKNECFHSNNFIAGCWWSEYDWHDLFRWKINKFYCSLSNDGILIWKHNENWSKTKAKVWQFAIRKRTNSFLELK